MKGTLDRIDGSHDGVHSVRNNTSYKGVSQTEETMGTVDDQIYVMSTFDGRYDAILILDWDDDA